MNYTNFKISIAASILLLFLVASGATGQIAQNKILNVKSFGAVGDGINNDSSAFQTAIIAASNQGSTLFVPRGTYLIANLLAFPGLVMEGQDSSSILKLSPTSINKSECLIFNKNSSNIKISNIFFDANGENSQNTLAYCVWTNLSPGKIQNISFTNCYFTGSKGYGALFLIGTEGAIQNVTVTSCRFFKTGASAVHIRGVSNMTFSNNYVTSWDLTEKNHPAFSLQSQETDNLVFSNNYFQNEGAGYFAIESAGAFVRHSQFINNIFNGNGLDAAGISGTFSDCLFKANRHIQGGGSHRSGYELIGDFDTVCNDYIDNGTIALGTNAPVPLEKGGNGYYVFDDTVIGNSVSYMCLGIGGVDTVRNAIVRNNIFDNRNRTGSSPAILIGSQGLVRNLTIADNIIYGSGSSACIRFTVTNGNKSGSSGVHILRNKFYGTRGIQIDQKEDWKKVEFSKNDFSNTTAIGEDLKDPSLLK